MSGPCRKSKTRRLGLAWTVVLACWTGSQCSNGDAEPGGIEMMLDPSSGTFFDMPYPNPLLFDRAAARIDLSRFPNPKKNTLVATLMKLAGEERTGFSVNPVVSFRFTGPLDESRLPRSLDQLPSTPYLVYFLNVDSSSAGHGRVIPAAAEWFAIEGNYTPANTLTMIPWPGLTLDPRTTFAAIVEKDVRGSDGRGLAASAPLRLLLEGKVPSDPDGEKLREAYLPLAEFLRTSREIKRDNIAAAMVFATAHPADDLRALINRVVAKETARWVEPLALSHEEEAFCYFEGKAGFPQVQSGEAPFRSDGGDISFDSAGDPVKVKTENVKVALTVPKSVMPSSGFPYLEYVHGSGGVTSEFVDRGAVLEPGGGETPWQGPGWIAAHHGFAAGSQAMPISPDRVAGTSSFDYLQINNPVSMRDNFRQGMIELFLRKQLLKELRLNAEACEGASSSDGSIRLDMSKHFTMGQSMGAMYANMFGALDPDTRGVIPTGSGGYWSYFLFSSDLVPGADKLLRALFDVPSHEEFSPLHPLMGLFQQFIEKVDPIVFTPHLVRSPLAGNPAKHLFIPHGYDDLYFSLQTQRAMSLAYGVPLVGEVVEPGMEEQLRKLQSVERADYPLAGNFSVSDGTRVTAAQNQWKEDSIQQNGHTVAFQLQSVQHQWGCFLETFLRDGIPRIVEPKDSRFAPCE